jgi:hypothetical protein
MELDIEYILQQIELHNLTYEWIVRESDKIAAKMTELDKHEFDPVAYDKLSKQFLELQERFDRDRKGYDKIVATVRRYFNDKHGIDIMGLLGDDI